MLKQIKAEAEAEGVNLVESDGQNSAPKQTADIEAAIVQKVNAIVISPLDVNALAPALEEAVQAGIPVVTIDRRVDGVEGILAHVGADNVKGGEAEAQAMVAAFPNGAKFPLLQGQPGAGPAIDRNKGAHNVLDPLKDNTRSSSSRPPTLLAQKRSVTEAGLAANGKPDAIICANDDMALGALEACAARNFTDVKIYGFDALPEALVAVAAGTLAGTVEQFPGEQSRTAVRIAVAYAKDKTEPKEKLVLLTPIVIGKDNLDKAEGRRDEVRRWRTDGGRSRRESALSLPAISPPEGAITLGLRQFPTFEEWRSGRRRQSPPWGEMSGRTRGCLCCRPAAELHRGRNLLASAEAMACTAALLTVEGVTKHFAGVTALSDVSLEVRPAKSSACSARTAPASRRCSRSCPA
jgi:ABC-type sugar transport system substrate-binding protein